MQSPLVRLLLSLTLVVAAPPPAPPAAPACESGTLNTNTTWLLASSPYTVCGVLTVAAGATLTIQPGVTVLFQAGNKLNVAGTLTALGTPTQTITFTGVSHAAGSWGGLSAVGTAITPAKVSLNHALVDYGGTAGSSGAAVYADQAALTITRSLIRNSAGNGVYVSINARLDAHLDQFTNNAQRAIQLNQPSSSLLMTELSASGNGADGVWIEGTASIHGQQRWTAPGVAYIVNAPVHTSQGDILTIDPGNTLAFTTLGWLDIRGGLSALGTPGQPITFTGQTHTAGSWRGLFLNGVSEAVTQLDHVTIEYGGSDIHGANIEVAKGRLIVHHSRIRYSATDGILFDSNSGGSILESEIVSNTRYGVWNSTPQRPVQATNNWWGDPSGPDSDVAQCPVGLGSRVTAGVFFQPVLTSTTATVRFPLSRTPNVTLTPRRWFAPADNTTKIYFDVTVRDGDGFPLPGRTVQLSASLGQATAGGITDQDGHTLAFLTSPTVGDAEVTGVLTTIGCEGYLAPQARVTFTPPLNLTDLFPEAPASYFDGNLSISPLPVIVGAPTVLSAKLTNPLTVPITVDVAFGFAQSSIGLAFGPIHDFVGQVIPAHSSLTLSTNWLPPISGHYCIQVTYSVTGFGASLALPAAGGSSGSQRGNLQAFPGSTGSDAKGNALDRTSNALDVMNSYIGNAFDTDPFSIPLELLNRGIQLQLNFANIISGALAGDPPRADFRQLDSPHKLLLPPVLPGSGLTSARAAALNALDDALAEANAAARAAAIALDRAGGASAAGDLQWSSLQAAAVIDYNQLFGTALITAAARIDGVLNVAAGEGQTTLVISTSDVISMQQHLVVGFDPGEIADAHAVGLTDADLTAIRQKILAAKPEDLAGDLVPRLRALRDEFLALSNVLLHPVAFAPGFSVSGGAGLQLPSDNSLAAPAGGNRMAQVFNTVSTFQLGNPLTHTALIDLSARRIDLPADWAVEISPEQVSLAPGQQVTVTVTLIAGSPVAQGRRPRVAVEGHAGAQLLGGVVFETVVPNYVFFDGRLRIYVPLVSR